MPRQEFARKTKAQAFERCGGKCEGCKVVGCNKPSARRGLCHAHYKRLLTNGTVGGPKVAEMGKTVRFIEEVALNHNSEDCLLWPYAKSAGGHGHLRIKGKDYLAHRIVCERVHGPAPSDKHEAAHSCGNGHLACVNPLHLRWATRKENEADKELHGTRLRGSEHHYAKLSESDVLGIRRLREKGMTLQKIADRYGVSIALVSMIHSRRVWRHLDA